MMQLVSSKDKLALEIRKKEKTVAKLASVFQGRSSQVQTWEKLT